MTTQFLRHAALLVTMDGQRREIADGALVIRDNAIAAVGTTQSLAPTWEARADQIVDLLRGVVQGDGEAERVR